MAVYRGITVEQGQEKDKKFIQSIGRAVSILEYVAKNKNRARLINISKDLKLNKSTLHCIISTLEQLDYLSQNEETGKYSLGVKLFELGKVYEQDLSVIEAARPFLKKLVEEYDETTHLATDSKYDVLYIDRVESTHSVRMTSNIGAKDDMHCTSVGKVLLAFMDEKRQEEFFKQKELKRHTPNTITEAGKLKEELQEIRSKGYGLDLEEIEIGLYCAAAPIRNHKGEVIAAISISGPTSRVSHDKLMIIKDRIVEYSKEISYSLGYR